MKSWTVGRLREHILDEVYEKLGLNQPPVAAHDEEEETTEQRPVEPAEQIL